MRKYSNLLSNVYLLMLLPQLLCSTILGSNYLLPMYIICYSCSIFLMFLYMNKNRIVAYKRTIKYFVIYMIILVLTFFSDFVIGLDIVKNDIFDAIVKLINLLFFMCLIPKIDIKPEELKPFYLKIFVIGIISCIYNIIVNYNVILSFTQITNSYEINLSSFFANRNTYGMFLFICIFCTFYLVQYNLKSNKKYYFGIALLLINLILTMSRGAILATILFIFNNYYYNSKTNIKKTIFLILFFVLLAFGGLIYLKMNPYYYNMILRLFVRSEVGTTGRSDLWRIGFNIAFNHNIINGVGFYTGLSLTNGLNQFHSFFVDNLVDGGLIGLIFKIVIVLRLYYLIIKNNNEDLLFLKNIYKSGFIGLIFLCFFESVNFFSLGFSEAQFTILFITLPSVIFIQNKANNKQMIKE